MSNTTGSGDESRVLLHEITRDESAARAGEALLVVPIGATEQHGPHLPLGTDFLIVEHVARAAAQAARQATELDVLVAPTLPFGSSHHHLPFGGTVSLASERYFAALRDMVASLIQGGFRRIFLLNGHGGNHELMQVVVRDLALDYPVNLGAASYWDLARVALTAAGLNRIGHLPGHAGVFETSLILALRPDLVTSPLPHRDEAELARVAIPRTPFRAERAGFWEGIDGFTDSPDQASAELGQRLLASVVPPVADAFASFAGLPLVNPESPDTRHPTPDSHSRRFVLSVTGNSRARIRRDTVPDPRRRAMDGHGFDLLTKRLALLATRRQGFRALLAGAGAAGLLGLEADEAAAACGGARKRCKKGNQCCSGICLPGRKKKGKKGRKKGRCDCSFPQEACNVGNDCCFPGSACGNNGCDPDNRCCFGEGAECIDPCECCTGFTCDFAGGGEFGLCVPCVALQEACVVGVDFCCDDGTFCDSNGGGSGDVCCLGPGFECEDDLDCCGQRQCSSRADNTCQTCPTLGDPCNPQNNTCCDKDAKCFDNAEGANNVCCLPDGAVCEETRDCCEDHFCHPTEKICVFDIG